MSANGTLAGRGRTFSAPSPTAWLAQWNQPSLHLALLAFLAPEMQKRHFDRAQLPETTHQVAYRQGGHVPAIQTYGHAHEARWGLAQAEKPRRAVLGFRLARVRRAHHTLEHIKNTIGSNQSERCAALWLTVPVTVYILVHVHCTR